MTWVSSPAFRSQTTSTHRDDEETSSEDLFTKSSSRSPEAQPYPWRAALLTLGLVLLILFLRRPEAFVHPTLWAEDGPVFLGESESRGAAALVQPYNGYHHLLPRLIALVVSPISLRWIPVAYLIGSVVALAGLVLAFFSPRLPLRARPLMALALVLVPHSGEVYNNLANLQWLGALGLLLLLLAGSAESWSQRVFDLISATVLGLTGIFSILFAPLFAWRWWQRRDVHSGLLVAIMLLCAAVQTGALHRTGLLAPQPWRVTGSITRTLALRTSGSLLLPPSLAQAAPTWALVILASILLALIARYWLTRPATRAAQILWLVSVVLLLVSTLYRFHGDVFVLRLVSGGDRYFFVPKVLLLWLFIQQLPTGGFNAWSAGVIYAAALFATCAGWRFEPYNDFGWAEQVAKLEHVKEIEIPINPPGISVHLRARRAH